MEPDKLNFKKEKPKEFKCLLCGKNYIITQKTISDGCPHCGKH